MNRCYISPMEWGGTVLTPTTEEAHHLRHVLRISDGDEVEVFDGQGRHAMALFRAEGKGAVVEVIEGSTRESLPSVRVVLLQALPKGKKMDFVVEKGTELGLSEIWPLVTDRVVARPDGKRHAEKIARWQRIALSAARQCGTSWVPSVKPICSISQALDSCVGFDLFIVGSLQDDARPLHAVLDEVRQSFGVIGNVGVLIGPEGDFTGEELKLAVDAGAVPVSFGSLVFRVETAALYAASVLAYEFGIGNVRLAADSGADAHQVP